MQVEVWADVVCPFCWIGRRHLEQAIQQVGADVQVVHRAYELNPDAGPSRPVLEYLGQRYGGGIEGARAMTARTAAMGEAAGLAFDFERAVVARTFDAHRVIHLARASGREEAVLERIMEAHFTQGVDLSDHGTLRRLGEEAGLDGKEVEAVLGSDRFADTVRQEEHEAHAMGAAGVPLFVFDRRLALVGAQPVEAFVQALARLQGTDAPPANVP